jgi:N-acetylmuramoyl-L-alanine amidase
VPSSKAYGAAAYILGPKSNNPENKNDYFAMGQTVAQRENSVIVLEDDYKTKYQTFDPDSPESYISHQLQWMAYYESSLLFATEVVNNLMQAPLTQRKSVIDQDIFQVLVEANMPAVLLELAFVTNPEEYSYLSSANGQEEVAARLFNAFKSYKMKFDQSVSVGRAAVSAPSVPVQVAARQAMPESQKVNSDYYSIQVMGLGRLIKGNDPAFKGLDIVPLKSVESSTYKYIYGKYTTLEEARLALPFVRKKFPDAFPVKVIDGKVEKAK